PMPGTIVRVEVAAGDAVEAGQVVAVIEAMKMETEIKAEKAGTVKEVLVGAKEVVTAGQAIISIVEEGAAAAAPAGGTEVAAPMPGTIVRVEVAEGDAVEAEQVVAVIEAMKMETEIKAPAAGTVKSILVGAKEVVTAGQAIMTIE
ncbi:MAG: acetyl-CoA carboxylase biotin carboxyl carrier protein subunit, partial [Lentisphaeria bacterium]|nr:acetyl-CoA carboxylase biotin carboxyl carrier protein subunit [Lentisphaeria bacterium]